MENNRILTNQDKVLIKDGEKMYFISLSEVRLFESDGNYVKVYFGKNRPMILTSLNVLEEKLSENYFFRANRKFIINLNWVCNIEPWFNGGLQVELNSFKVKTNSGNDEFRPGEKVEISRRQTIKFKELFNII